MEGVESDAPKRPTKLYAIMHDINGDVRILEASSYSELRTEFKNIADDVRIVKLIRGREVPVRQERTVKFF